MTIDIWLAKYDFPDSHVPKKLRGWDAVLQNRGDELIDIRFGIQSSQNNSGTFSVRYNDKYYDLSPGEVVWFYATAKAPTDFWRPKGEIVFDDPVSYGIIPVYGWKVGSEYVDRSMSTHVVSYTPGEVEPDEIEFIDEPRPQLPGEVPGSGVTFIEGPEVHPDLAIFPVMARWWGEVTKATTEFTVNKIIDPLGFLSPVLNFFGDPVGNILLRIKDVFTSSKIESTILATDLVKDLLAGSTPEMASLESEVKGFSDKVADKVLNESKSNVLPDADATPKDATDYLVRLASLAHNINLGLFGMHVGIEAGSLGQFEFMGQYPGMVLNKFGYDALIRANAMLPIEKSVLKKAEYYFNSVFTPEIPGTQDLINMVVKEKLTLSEFKGLMKQRGFSSEYSQLIWDAHFTAPSLGQMLTVFRRGDMSASELRELQILVDLDPVYSSWGDRGVDIWGAQWYHDPTPRQARWGFEEGAIDKERVRDVVVRSGMLPGDVEWFTEMLIRFQERPYKTRWVNSLSRAYELGVYSEDELREEFSKEKVSPDIARWIAKDVEVKRKISGTKVKPDRGKLLTLSIAKDAYMTNEVDEPWLEDYFRGKGYDDDDIRIALSVWKTKKGSD